MAMILRSQEPAAASRFSSTATSDPCFSYDVFLSFRGEDTRRNFTDHLYTALKQAGIRTFRDDDEMDRGKLLDPELKKAIRQSAISIIVFSQNYASSKWCLDEVLTIMEERERLPNKHEVVPVFYNVEPTDVRNQTGRFAEAFGWYEGLIEATTDHQKKKEWVEKVKAWRDSLRKAANLTGMVLANRHEAEFIIEIVNVIRKKLDYKALYIEENLVGVQANVNVIDSWLQDPSPDAVTLVIDGIGGIGKTTISKCIFNSNFREYDCSCFLADITETSNQHGLIRLQSQLLSTILKSQKEETIWNVHEGVIKVKDAICNKKVLLVLDDVTTTEQLKALLGPQRVHHGSKVIITTRQKGLFLHAFKVSPKVYTIRESNSNDSIELFCLNAFHQVGPIEAYIVQSQLVVRYCEGLPLALKVLGSSLYGKSVDVWEDAMRKLEAFPHSRIQKVLQLSYDSLEDDSDKDLFLHIACFFVGEDRAYVMKLLSECDLYPVVGIQNLMDRSLLYVEKDPFCGRFAQNEKLMMHRLIKEMGQEVVRQESPKVPGKRSRLWHHQDTVNVLKEGTGTQKVEGLFLDMQRVKEANLTSTIKMDNARTRGYEEHVGKIYANEANFKIGALEKMKNLKLLQLDYATFSGRYKKMPEKLRLLCWHGFPLNVIPSDIALEKLVILDMRYSKLKHVWNGLKLIPSLKILNLSYSRELTKTPDFRGLPSLESLILEGCSSLMEVCKFISDLEGLALLDITNCTSLREIPCLPRSLVSLQMSGCPGIVARSQRLDSSFLPSVLVKLNISHCNLFDGSFPVDWSNLFSLKKLDISGNNINSLPNCIQSLPSLVELYAFHCSQLQSVTGLPKTLCLLDVHGNTSLEKVQPPPNPLANFIMAIFQTNCKVEGCFKMQSIAKVDFKIIRYLGLESTFKQGMELGLNEKVPIQVFYEFGIFSCFALGNTLLSSNFSYKEKGSKISFRVPSYPHGSCIIGLNVCFMSSNAQLQVLQVVVTNKTKALVWKYRPTKAKLFTNETFPKENLMWLSLWRCGNLLEDGDEIDVCIRLIDGSVDECCINIVYEEDGDLKDNKEVDGNEISWTDRMPVEISDYVHYERSYIFTSGPIMFEPKVDCVVDWWGKRTSCRSRWFT